MDIPFDMSAINKELYGDERPRMRIKGTVTDKFGEEAIVGVSIPVGATEDEKKAIFDSIMQVTNEAAEFNRLPREQKLEHYLRIAYKGLHDIMHSTQTNLKNLEIQDWENPTVMRLFKQLSNACSKADMTCIQLPSEFRPSKTN